MKPDWHFPSVEFGEETGADSPGIALFKGNAFSHLVRETIQNSIDANVQEVVTVKFKKVSLEKNLFPSLASLSSNMKLSATSVDLQVGGRKTLNSDMHLLKEGMSHLESEDGACEFLEISDYGTKGLSGAYSGDSRTNRFTKLLFKVGTNTLSGYGGGTHGHGKHAPFAASKLRTVFYSTVFQGDDGTNQEAFMGKTILADFTDGNKKFRGTGYFAVRDGNNIRPVNYEFIPEVFQRKTTGTSIFVAMPTSEFGGDNWIDDLLESVIDNYYAAIIKGFLVVEALNGDTSTVINSENILGLAETLESRGRFAKDSISPYILAVQAKGGPLKAEIQSNDSGEFKLYAHKTSDNQSGPTCIHYMRKPRQRVNKWKFNIGVSLRGTFIVEDKSGNESFAMLESSTHDEWPDGKPLVKKARQWARAILLEQFTEPPVAGESLAVGKAFGRTPRFEVTKVGSLPAMGFKKVLKVASSSSEGGPESHGRSAGGPMVPNDGPVGTPGTKATRTPGGDKRKDPEVNVVRKPQSSGGKKKASSQGKRAKGNGFRPVLGDEMPTTNLTPGEVAGDDQEVVIIEIKNILQIGRDQGKRPIYRLNASVNRKVECEIRVKVDGFAGDSDGEKESDYFLPLHQVKSLTSGVAVSDCGASDRFSFSSEKGCDFKLDITSDDPEWLKLDLEVI
jgi:hypothetical protein